MDSAGLRLLGVTLLEDMLFLGGGMVIGCIIAPRGPDADRGYLDKRCVAVIAVTTAGVFFLASKVSLLVDPRALTEAVTSGFSHTGNRIAVTDRVAEYWIFAILLATFTSLGIILGYLRSG